MEPSEIIMILFTGSLLAGLIGALSGLGGGIIIIPMLVLLLDIDIHYAIGASLIAVIATSTGASIAFTKEGFSNIRAAIFLETATTMGAIIGVLIGSHLPTNWLAIIFGAILFYCGISAFFSHETDTTLSNEDSLSKTLKLDSNYPTAEGLKNYRLKNIPLGYFIMFIAGAVSGILGIGSGALKVIALDKAMKMPFKVSTTTSNFMIGVTAATSAGIYFKLGYIDPFLTSPVVLGVIVGSFLGARLLPKVKTKHLRYLFACLVIGISIQMIYQSLSGELP